jgi:Mrp family chromosome partitioning ATPase
LEARIDALTSILSKIRDQASKVMEMEPKIAEVTRRREEAQKSYDAALASYEAIRRDDTQAAGKASNISIVENPTPARLDYKKLLQGMAMAFGACAGLGFGLAFLIDFVLDRSIKRSSDVEKHLRLPLFLSIPDTAWSGAMKLPSWLTKLWLGRGREGHMNGHNAAGMELSPWEPGNELQKYAEGLRERLMTYFEVSNLNLKKPKLVAVTGCGEGSGTTTLASGLAAALSKTGDGNVLLVDMNDEQGVAHSFYKGQPGCGLTDALEPDSRAEAQVQENLYLASINNNQGGALSKVLPTRFTHLMPKLKASDYDYIIFDMPPVSPTSATPRLASYMDIVLLVLESEKTGQHSATRAAALMRDARANVAAVLNKCRQYVPPALSHEV